MENYKSIEGINFDLRQIKQDIADIGGKEKFIERAKQIWWTDSVPPINEATQLKRIQAVYDAAMAYKEPGEEAPKEKEVKSKN